MSSWRIDDGKWRAQAACNRESLEDRAEHAEAFFPEGRPPREPFQDCARCPVRDMCLETALSSPWKPYGIWAGKTSRELEPLWRARHPRSRENEILQLLGVSA